MARKDFLLPPLSEEQRSASIDSGRSRLSYETARSVALVPLSQVTVNKEEQNLRFTNMGTPMSSELSKTTTGAFGSAESKLRRQKMRDWYNIAKERSKQLGKKSANTAISSVIHSKQAAKIYSLLCTVLQTSINIEKMAELEKFIRRKSVELPPSLVDLQELLPILRIARESREEYVSKNRRSSPLLDKDTILHLFELSASIRKVHDDIQRLKYQVNKEVEATDNVFKDFRSRLLLMVSSTKIDKIKDIPAPLMTQKLGDVQKFSESQYRYLFQEEFDELRRLRGKVLDKIRVVESVGDTDALVKGLTNLWNDHLIQAFALSGASHGVEAADWSTSLSNSALALRRHNFRTEARKSDVILEQLRAIGVGAEGKESHSILSLPTLSTRSLDAAFDADMQRFLRHASGAVPNASKSAAALAVRGPAGELQFTSDPLDGFFSSAESRGGHGVPASSSSSTRHSPELVACTGTGVGYFLGQENEGMYVEGFGIDEDAEYATDTSISNDPNDDAAYDYRQQRVGDRGSKSLGIDTTRLRGVNEAGNNAPPLCSATMHINNASTHAPKSNSAGIGRTSVRRRSNDRRAL